MGVGMYQYKDKWCRQTDVIYFKTVTKYTHAKPTHEWYPMTLNNVSPDCKTINTSKMSSETKCCIKQNGLSDSYPY